jgi:hypothetical protein
MLPAQGGEGRRPPLPRLPEGAVDPAHPVPRSLDGGDAPDCVVPLCRLHHRRYDRGQLDLLPHLEPRCRAELQDGLGHGGLLGLLRPSRGFAGRRSPSRPTKAGARRKKLPRGGVSVRRHRIHPSADAGLSPPAQGAFFCARIRRLGTNARILRLAQ